MPSIDSSASPEDRFTSRSTLTRSLLPGLKKATRCTDRTGGAVAFIAVRNPSAAGTYAYASPTPYSDSRHLPVPGPVLPVRPLDP